ncbi:MAG: hypothetical protein LW822_10460 [Phycisphaeraceae bacterium]|nr:hypothetical protein [Phycisphaeraceae bacterium]
MESGARDRDGDDGFCRLARDEVVRAAHDLGNAVLAMHASADLLAYAVGKGMSTVSAMASLREGIEQARQVARRLGDAVAIAGTIGDAGVAVRAAGQGGQGGQGGVKPITRALLIGHDAQTASLIVQTLRNAGVAAEILGGGTPADVLGAQLGEVGVLVVDAEGIEPGALSAVARACGSGGLHWGIIIVGGPAERLPAGLDGPRVRVLSKPFAIGSLKKALEEILSLRG